MKGVQRFVRQGREAGNRGPNPSTPTDEHSPHYFTEQKMNTERLSHWFKVTQLGSGKSGIRI